jgi:hypothetical protein
MPKITHLIDVEAPCEDVFSIVTDIHKRMQLSPLWGISQLQEISPTYPQAGSHYQVQVLQGMPFGISQGTLNASQSALAGLTQMLYLKLGAADTQSFLDGSKTAEEGPGAGDIEGQPENSLLEQVYLVDEYHPPGLFHYHLDHNCNTSITWRFQSIPLGTRVIYEEDFCEDNVIGGNFIPTLNRVVREWLTNIKKYSELRGARGRLLLKWFLDRLYLRMRPDQRRMVQVLLVMQAIGLGTFLVAAVVWGIGRLVSLL